MYSQPLGPTVVVASGATDSPAMVVEHTIADATQLAIKSPATMPEVVTIQYSFDFNVNYLRDKQTLAVATAAATWHSHATALGVAGAVVIIDMATLLAAAWRLHLNGAAAADRTFLLVRRTPLGA